MSLPSSLKTLELTLVAKALNLDALPKELIKNIEPQSEKIDEQRQRIYQEIINYVTEFQKEKEEILKPGIEKAAAYLERKKNDLEEEIIPEVKRTAPSEVMQRFNLSSTSHQ